MVLVDVIVVGVRLGVVSRHCRSRKEIHVVCLCGLRGK